ncbi:ABC transporter ATP-binding protein [Microvirga antarctica]|uniref:ABC transporter ATP-binding protein n=1 Tax=Microvirga antarctica TaxID=2819233 RepID=UPI001B316BD8|nr:ABC transporter ATP-binding protein [Microvirga antarctica]
MPAVSAVEFQSVSKFYGASLAVDDVSFTIEKGTLVTLLGPSGCGKTTTLRMIAGLEMSTWGKIIIDGQDVTGVPPTRRDVSMVFQSYALFPHMSVLHNVAYGLRSSGQSRASAEAGAADALGLLGLEHLAQRLPSELSGGQQQRVAVARAIVMRPAVLLFDEPLSNLDAKLRRHVRDEIRSLQQRLNLTVVYVTHDQDEAFAVSDRIIVMDNKRIAQEGAPVELYRAPANRFVAGFLGEANIVRARLTRGDADLGRIAVGGSMVLWLPHRNERDGEVELAVRPEAISIEESGTPENSLPGRIQHSVFLGDRVEYAIETEIGRLFVVDFRTERFLEAGAEVRIGIRQLGAAILPDRGAS